MTYFVLNGTTPIQCFNLTLLNDGVAEGSESNTLSLEEVLTSDLFGIKLVQPNVTTIEIINSDSELAFLFCTDVYTCMAYVAYIYI